jgi:hypothetical protein
MLSVVDRTVVTKIRRTALILTKEASLADQFAEEVKLTEDERRDIANLAEVVCQQYELMGQHMPAALLLTHLAFYGGRVALTMHQLNQIADFNAKRAAVNKPATPAPAPATP